MSGLMVGPRRPVGAHPSPCGAGRYSNNEKIDQLLFRHRGPGNGLNERECRALLRSDGRPLTACQTRVLEALVRRGGWANGLDEQLVFGSVVREGRDLRPAQADRLVHLIQHPYVGVTADIQRILHR